MNTVTSRLKRFILSHEPFLPMHAGLWIRLAYFKHYFFRYADAKRMRNILDAGCGRGRYAALLARRLPKAHVTGYDLLSHEEWTGYRLPNLHFEVKDLHMMTDRAAFDAIVSVDSLEHIPDNKKILASFHQALRPGGVLYLAIPNESEEWHFFPKKWFAHFREWEEHEHIGEQYTLTDLSRIITSLGFRLEYARHTFTLWGALAWEIEFLLHHNMRRLYIVAMPLIKLLGIFDVYIPFGKGNNLVIAKKP